ncbi:RHS repeat protein [Stigmatella erecta]|uniref:YD repeat-containing protein n=1 Tax=Stigmatella erecta TaxID=83460 RepID=A0A1I0L630_9BACT|nr:RHS repeat protein [Stigmatella erecta]SEU34477.1 YD repeat-containing protein [Stigmatella erecta]
MAQRPWVSFGVAVFLGLVGCASPPEENVAGEEGAPPGEALPVQGPPTEEAAPGAGPELPQQEAPSGSPEALCPAANLGATPTEAIVDPRPNPRICAFSPDGCDAHRPSHARRAVPRPCRVWDPTPYSSGDYRLQHDASGRLTQIEGPREWYEGFTYDACGRLTQYGKSPLGSMSTYFDEWEWTAEGQFLRWRFSQNSWDQDLSVERDAQGTLLGAARTHEFNGPYVTEKHAYTLDAQGRIARTEAISRNPEGQLTERAWQETRRYGASGALEEIRRESSGKLSWVQEFSQGRRVRHAGGDGSWETRWTYGLSGELLAYSNQSQTQRLQVSYQYGEDGRLLRTVETVQARTATGWSESQHLSEYSYAGDGRILSRKDRTGTLAYTYVYEYTCEPDASGP